MLGIGSTTSDVALLGELGRNPLALHYKMRCVKYWLKLLKLPDQRMSKACYKMLKNPDENGRKTWANDGKLLLQTFEFNYVWLQQGVGELVFLEIFLTRSTNYYLEKMGTNKGDSSKLAIYHTFKSELELERYLLMTN